MSTDDDAKAKAIQQLPELIHKRMSVGATVTSALDISEIFPEFKKHVFRSHVAGKTPMRQVMSQLVGKDGEPINDETFLHIAKGLAEQASVNAEIVVSAASIVLAHSAVDDIFTGICRIAVDLDPDEWKVELNLDRTVKLGDLNKYGVDRIFMQELEDFKKKLGNKSLPSRAAILFRHVPIRKHMEITKEESAYYKESKLEEADELRHEIVHGMKLPVISITKAKRVTSFLFEAADTAVRSILFRFKLPLDMTQLATAFAIKSS